MLSIGIVGNGPETQIPRLLDYTEQIDMWIGVDRGALTLINNDINVTIAVGDFDSVDEAEKKQIRRSVYSFSEASVEKDQTDLAIAIDKALTFNPKNIYLFGVTGGRLDHLLINIQLLFSVVKAGIRGFIIDHQNKIELTFPGKHQVTNDHLYPYISFIPFSQHVQGLTLSGFYYPLKNRSLSWGSTLCISNMLLSNSGTFSYEEGILLLIKSRDSHVTIPK